MSISHSPQQDVSVTLAVGGASYQKTLAASLLSQGMLRRVLGSGPFLEIQDPQTDGSLREIKRFPLNRIVNRLAWGVWRRLLKGLRVRSPVMPTVLMKDYIWSQWVPPCDVFHGWMGQSLATFRVCKERGIATLLENGGCHPRHFHTASHKECRRFSIPPSEWSPLLPAALVRRMEREYEICDRIVVPSVVARDSFTECGLGNKAVIVLPGVDEHFFHPSERGGTSEAPFRACFVGRVELAKGVGYLLKAWKRLKLANAQLLLVGEVRPEMRALLADADASVRVTGVVGRQELADFYRSSNLFVFPSVNEGLAQVLLEAMASGLPIVAADLSGAIDCVADGKEGFIVPARDVDRLADAILSCYQHPDATQAMGRAARDRVEREFTLDHYNQRMIGLYRAVGKVPNS